jgi:hypothetical protein
MAEFTYHLSSALKRRVHSFVLSIHLAIMTLTSRVIGIFRALASRYRVGISFSSILNERIFTSPSIPAVVAHCSTVSRENYRVASTIPDDREVTSIENKTFPFVLADEILNRLVNLDALLPFFLHGKILWGTVGGLI